jgi:hypothetical protein
MSLANAYRYAPEVMTENIMARDAEEGIGAALDLLGSDIEQAAVGRSKSNSTPLCWC